MPKLKRGKHMRCYLMEVVLKQKHRRGRRTIIFQHKSTRFSAALISALRRVVDDLNVACIYDWKLVEWDKANREKQIDYLRQRHQRRAQGLTERSIMWLLPTTKYAGIVGLPKSTRLKDLTKAGTVAD